MNEPVGDKLFWAMIVVFCAVFIIGWIILLIVMLLQWIIPKLEGQLEVFLQKANTPIGLIQKYSIYCALILFVLRLIVGWLGWASPL